jgi:hypothetical protein
LLAWNNLGSNPTAIPVSLTLLYSVFPPSASQNSSGSSPSLNESFTLALSKNYSKSFLPNLSSGSFAPSPSHRYTSFPPLAITKYASPLLRFPHFTSDCSNALAESPYGA